MYKRPSIQARATTGFLSSLGGGLTAFAFTVDTTNTSSGSSTSTQFRLPLVSTGNYAFDIDWGDSSSDTITAWNQSETTHTYSSSGIYIVSITGTIEGWRFANAGDKLKITNVQNWGPLVITTDRAFDYCENLTFKTAPDAPTISTTSVESMFRRNRALTTESLVPWDFNGVQNFKRFLREANSFNGAVDGVVTSSATSLWEMFHSASAFNQPFTSWTTSSVTNMQEMMRLCAAYDQNIGLLDWTAVTTASGMLIAVTLSTSTYDAVLQSINAQSVNNSVSFHGGNSKYSIGGDGESARAALVTDHSWTITDGGGV